MFKVAILKFGWESQAITFTQTAKCHFVVHLNPFLSKTFCLHVLFWALSWITTVLRNALFSLTNTSSPLLPSTGEINWIGSVETDVETRDSRQSETGEIRWKSNRTEYIKLFNTWAVHNLLIVLWGKSLNERKIIALKKITWPTFCIYLYHGAKRLFTFVFNL